MSGADNHRKVISGALPYSDKSGYAVGIKIEEVDGVPMLDLDFSAIQLCYWDEVCGEINDAVAAYMLICGASKEGDKP